MTQRDLRDRLVEAAMSYPGASEDFPWGERVSKVNKKIFAFFGTDDGTPTGVTIKLPNSCDFALSFSSVASAGYGLGKAGWVHLDFDHPECPEIELLIDWLDESYRAVAPKRLVAELDAAERPDR